MIFYVSYILQLETTIALLCFIVGVKDVGAIKNQILFYVS